MYFSTVFWKLSRQDNALGNITLFLLEFVAPSQPKGYFMEKINED
jgi:hypothetical protein